MEKPKEEVKKEELKEEPKLSEVEENRKNLEELTTTNDAIEAQLVRKEQLRAKVVKGGQTTAGQNVEDPKDIKVKEMTEDIVNAFN